MTTMPGLNLKLIKTKLAEAQFPDEVHEWVGALIATKGKNAGCLRAAKPSGSKMPGEAKYIWRMVAFYISPLRHHQCMPVTCAYEVMITDDEIAQAIEGGMGTIYSNVKFGLLDTPRECYVRRTLREGLVQWLDMIVDIIVNTVPYKECHGLKAWGRALG